MTAVQLVGSAAWRLSGGLATLLTFTLIWLSSTAASAARLEGEVCPMGTR